MRIRTVRRTAPHGPAPSAPSARPCRTVRLPRSVRAPGPAGPAGAVAAAAAALALLSAAPATASPAPGFLAPDQLPPHASSPWRAGDVTDGLPDPEPFCMDGALPDEPGGTHHRVYGTEYDTGAVQVTVVSRTPEAAGELAARLERRAAGCAAGWQAENPDGTADGQDYGTVDAGDSAHVYGVHTAPPESEHGVSLFGIAREGSTVTLVRWAQMGTLDDAPVDAFRGTTATAVHNLRH